MRIGFIGGGKMAEAIISGLIKKKSFKPEEISVLDISSSRMDFLSEKYGILPAGTLRELFEKSNTIILAVKPGGYKPILEEAKAFIGEEHLIVSIMAGVTIAELEKALPGKALVRIMPNTPMLVGEGVCGLCGGNYASSEQTESIKALFHPLGRVFVLPERLIDPLTSISGCGPAFVYMLIEAMADGAVSQGIPRETAIELAAATAAGAGRMVLETMEHPEKLKDDVCSPAGATIAGTAELDRRGFRGIVIDAVLKSGGISD